MAGAVLDLRALNRALLARQWLLDPPRATTALEAIEHLGGLQAQDVKAPYFQLWSRLADFEPAELSGLLERRDAVRIVAMRGTIHLVSARDAPLLRALAQPALSGQTNSNHRVPEDVDRVALADAGRALVDAEPRTFAQLAAELGERWPHADGPALAQQVRARVPLVQVPPRGLWGRSGPAAHTSLANWTGDEPPPHEDLNLAPFVLRYLAAFGPARPADFQKWSGRTGAAHAFERLRSDHELVVFEDEQGRELFDLPDAPRPAGDTPAPPRLTGPFDNLILSHVDTSRVLPPAHKPLVMTQNGLIAGLVLLDGFVAGNWRIKATKKLATVTITQFGKTYNKRDAAAVAREAHRLLDVVAPTAADRDVAFAAPTPAC
ncbi:winged helix DNA-binding domain-containing protein [Baekduia sp. Peel2402]|uniref:winged helix DNA-binding domain-containing protein n=1 Tax=Baekduia sp. Peel2402 TaxID=3458296 RepID=UPI00403E4134